VEVAMMADPAMLYNISVKDADRMDTLRDFFRESGREYMVDDAIPADVITVHATDLGFRDALNLLLPATYGVMEDEGGVYHIQRAA
jgi:hypothetical protein